MRDAGEIERGVTAFARAPNGGLIVTTAGSGSPGRRSLIIALAARHKLPAVYPYRYHVTGGGLISYGPDMVDQYRRATGYVAHPQGREAGRPAGAGAGEVRTGDQPENR